MSERIATYFERQNKGNLVRACRSGESWHVVRISSVVTTMSDEDFRARYERIDGALDGIVPPKPDPNTGWRGWMLVAITAVLTACALLRIIGVF